MASFCRPAVLPLHCRREIHDSDARGIDGSDRWNRPITPRMAGTLASNPIEGWVCIRFFRPRRRIVSFPCAPYSLFIHRKPGPYVQVVCIHAMLSTNPDPTLIREPTERHAPHDPAPSGLRTAPKDTQATAHDARGPISSAGGGLNPDHGPMCGAESAPCAERGAAAAGDYAYATAEGG